MFMIISPLRPCFLCFIAKFSLNLFLNDCSTMIYSINNDITSILDITVMKTQRGGNRDHCCFGSQEQDLILVKSCIYKVFLNEVK